MTSDIRKAYEIAREFLLAERTAQGHWEGRLSSSALSTATAVSALAAAARESSAPHPDPLPQGERDAPHPFDFAQGRPDPLPQANSAPHPHPPPQGGRELIDAGVLWLVEHQNADGGWGDTPDSPSNLATTMLVRAALCIAQERCKLQVAGCKSAAKQDDANSHAQPSELPPSTWNLEPVTWNRSVERAEEYLTRVAGASAAGRVAALRGVYGEDSTFAAPILTNCAIAGLVDWKDVPSLPFELARLPQGWFRFARLHVVSYALPALIAIGQVVHQKNPSRNPLARWVRAAAIEATLARLEAIQPQSGGFLEATPLTSFVVMSLAAAGRAEHPVARKGVDFLVRSARPDGSWPIDTNLATWLTTQAVDALAADGEKGVRGNGDRGNGDRHPKGVKVPVTVSSPEGACASRSGSGPDPVFSLRRWLLDQQRRSVHPYTGSPPGGWAWTDLSGGVPDADDTAGALIALAHLGVSASDPASAAGVGWLLDLQNRDGGWPTFCRGWGKLPFDRSAADLTAHAIRALTATRGSRHAARAERAIARGFDYLRRTQRPDGSWLPLWFGSQHAADRANPVYGTSRVLVAYAEAGRLGSDEALRAARYLAAAQNGDGGWGGAAGAPSTVEETALAVRALAPVAGSGEFAPAFLKGCDHLAQRISKGGLAQPAPMGLYFAMLWYSERLYPALWSVAALGAALKAGTAQRPETDLR